MRKPTQAEIIELVDAWCEDEWPVIGDAEERRGAIEHNIWVREQRKELAAQYRADPAMFWESLANYQSGGPDEHAEEYHRLLNQYMKQQ